MIPFSSHSMSFFKTFSFVERVKWGSAIRLMFEIKIYVSVYLILVKKEFFPVEIFQATISMENFSS